MAGAASGDDGQVFLDLAQRLKNGEISREQMFRSLVQKATSSDGGGTSSLDAAAAAAAASPISPLNASFADAAYQHPSAAPNLGLSPPGWTNGTRAPSTISVGDVRSSTASLTGHERKAIIQKLAAEQARLVQGLSQPAFAHEEDHRRFHQDVLSAGTGEAPLSDEDGADWESDGGGGYGMYDRQVYNREDSGGDDDDGDEDDSDAWQDERRHTSHFSANDGRGESAYEHMDEDWDEGGAASELDENDNRQQPVHQSQYLSFSEERARQKRAQEAAVLREANKHCTFRPQIKELPRTYGGGSRREPRPAFLQRVSTWQRDKSANARRRRQDAEYAALRVSTWQRDKSANARRRRQDAEYAEMHVCSFRPEINFNSRRATAFQRGHDGDALKTSERLHAEAHQRRIERLRATAEQQAAEARELERSCTFEPIMSPNRSGQHVRSRYRQAAANAALRRRSTDDGLTGHQSLCGGDAYELEKCTFTPAIIGAKYEELQLHHYDGGLRRTMPSSCTDIEVIKSVALCPTHDCHGSTLCLHCLLQVHNLCVTSAQHAAMVYITKHTPDDVVLPLSLPSAPPRNGQENMPNAREYLQHNVVDRLTGAAFLQPALQLELDQQQRGSGSRSGADPRRARLEAQDSRRSYREDEYGQSAEDDGSDQLGEGGGGSAYADDDEDAARAVREALADAQELLQLERLASQAGRSVAASAPRQQQRRRSSGNSSAQHSAAQQAEDAALTAEIQALAAEIEESVNGDWRQDAGDGEGGVGGQGDAGGRGGARSAAAAASLRAFLARQSRWDERRRAHVAHLQSRGAPTFTPEMVTAAQGGGDGGFDGGTTTRGSFLQRLARDALRKEHEFLRLKNSHLQCLTRTRCRCRALLQAARDDRANCTFAPQITARSRRRSGRSVLEMSRGDQLRRETNVRLSRLRMEREQLGDVTFEPQLNDGPASRGVKSHLQVVSDPESYIARVQARQRRRDERTLNARVARAAAEAADCTFQPQTAECPAYVRRIAASMAEARAAAAAEAARPRSPPRPDWR
ncbi:hypothetical protein JKP88DRAFT_252533 [Tribonema minus]|uniref:Uncharacterized protein n=1 Tax=Tribonema minus TaxID=303371 RepID=A0A835ZG99_9STRA|nr:hypothetical protein JKP88DRAFT_252533 [Tribonema minus]